MALGQQWLGWCTATLMSLSRQDIPRLCSGQPAPPAGHLEKHYLVGAEPGITTEVPSKWGFHCKV